MPESTALLSRFCQSKVYAGMLGAALGTSVVHYAANATRLSGDVPIHFDYRGRPDSFASQKFFFMYPALVALFTGFGYMLHTGEVRLREGDRPVACVALVASNFLLVCCQISSARISQGKSTRMPVAVLAAAIFTIGSCSVYSLINGLLISK